MNSVDLFYRIFRLRYNMEDIKRSFVGRYSLCLMGLEEDCTRMREWMGDYSLSSGIHPEKNLCVANFPSDEEEGDLYRNMDGIVVHLGVRPWPMEEFADLVECMPVGVPILYICEPVAWEGEFDEYMNAGLPEVVCLRAGHEDKHFATLLFKRFKRIGFRLARDYQNLRDVCISSLIMNSSNSMALVAAASSVTVNVPVVGQLLSIFASPVETVAITAEQMRLVLYIGALYGKPLDFFDRINELWMVVGGGWCWRTLARQVVGMVPGGGFVAKAGVAWTGTFAVGEASRRFYELGEVMPVNIREVVTNSAKKEIVRAARLQFQNDMATATVANMLTDVEEALATCGDDNDAASGEFTTVCLVPQATDTIPQTKAAATQAVDTASQASDHDGAMVESAPDEDTLTEDDGVVLEEAVDTDIEIAPEPHIDMETAKATVNAADLVSAEA